jgi:hypothetical protein
MHRTSRDDLGYVRPAGCSKGHAEGRLFFMTWHLFLDESGDLGFDFENTQCSKNLTIAILAASQPATAMAIRGAVKKTLARKVNRGKKGRNRPAQELKGASTSIQVKRYFYDLVKHQQFGIYAMTLDKKHVTQELCSTPASKERLYNYVARQVVDKIPFEHATASVEIIVDRSKGKIGIADFDSFIVQQLHGRLHPSISLRIRHQYSHSDHGLSAADLFCWGIFRSRERGDSAWRDMYAEKILLDEKYQ